MKVFVILEQSTLNLIWACSDAAKFAGQHYRIDDDHAAVAVDHDVVVQASRLHPGAETLDEAIRLQIEGGA